MKFRIITLIITLGLPFVILSQSINIHEKNGTVHNYDMSKIDSITFTQGGSGMPCPGIETVEYEGKTYNTVQIGEQCWLQENLNIGTMIASNTDSDNQTDNGVIEKYCYGNDEVNCDTYGGLYQWDEAMTYSTTEGAQGICPPGWHIPSLAEYETLSDLVGGDANALKSVGQGAESGAGSNLSGFSALLAGRRRGNGSFFDLGSKIWFRSSTEFNEIEARYMSLSGNDSNVSFFETNKSAGFSVRCLKD